jgi:hypothetical protein
VKNWRELMPRIAYESNTMRGHTLAVAEQAVAIAEEYANAGYELTLRQLYYQFVARGLTANWPTGANTERSYKRLGTIVDKARMNGMMDWYYIVDRTRGAAAMSHWSSPRGIIEGAARGYAIDKWTGQEKRVELWVEKEALSGIIAGVANDRDCTYMACRGYLSSSAMWQSAQRLGRILAGGQDVVVLHLGDHDPSGIDMSRDNFDRLVTFIGHDQGFDAVDRMEFRRIALNMDQVEEYNPPPNPAKMSDSRAEGYVEQYGMESWELDALPPDALVTLMNEHIDGEVDPDVYAQRERWQEEDRERLRLAADNWPAVASWVDSEFGEGA